MNLNDIVNWKKTIFVLIGNWTTLLNLDFDTLKNGMKPIFKATKLTYNKLPVILKWTSTAGRWSFGNLQHFKTTTYSKIIKWKSKAICLFSTVQKLKKKIQPAQRI